MTNKVHIFGSGLGANRIESKNYIEIVKELDRKSDFLFNIVIDIEEVLRGNTIDSVIENKKRARENIKNLLQTIEPNTNYKKYKGIIARVNPIHSNFFEQDIEFFKKLTPSEKNKIQGIYLPDCEDKNDVINAANSLKIPIHKVMPIIETQEGHNNIKDIASTLTINNNGNDTYIIGTGDAYHRFLNRAEQNQKNNEIHLTPDTSLGHDQASILAHEETISQINKLNNFFQSGGKLMLATSTLIDKTKNPGDITAYAIDYYNKILLDQYHISGNPIGKVIIDPIQSTISDHYKKTGLLNKNTPLNHNLHYEEIIKHYIDKKINNQKAILDGYIIVDVQFYIAVFKYFKKHGVGGAIKHIPGLKHYMGKNSSLLGEHIFDQFKNEIIQYS